jgi:hypothetical protein
MTFPLKAVLINSLDVEVRPFGLTKVAFRDPHTIVPRSVCLHAHPCMDTLQCASRATHCSRLTGEVRLDDRMQMEDRCEPSSRAPRFLTRPATGRDPGHSTPSG